MVQDSRFSHSKSQIQNSKFTFQNSKVEKLQNLLVPSWYRIAAVGPILPLGGSYFFVYSYKAKGGDLGGHTLWSYLLAPTST